MNKTTLALLTAAVLLNGCSKDEAPAKAAPEAPQATAAAPATEQASAEPETTATEEAPAAAPQAAPEEVVVDGFASPESIVSYGGSLYISNLGKELKPTEKDGDGFILVTDPTGNPDKASKLEIDSYLHAPKGMMVLDDTLYVTDVNYIYGFLISDNSLLFAVEPGLQHPEDPQPKFLNDLAVGGEDNFFVSATDTNKIYRITLSFGAPTIELMDIQGKLNGPNGLTFDQDSNTLYVVGFGTDNQPNGELGAIDLSAKPYKYTRLGKHSGYLDGLVKVGNRLIFSDWVKFEKAGHIHSYNLDTGEQTQLTSEPIAGPADFIVSDDGKNLIVPAMIGNEIITIPLS